MIIDTHCHIDNHQYKDDVDEVIANAQKNGVEAIIIPGASLSDLPRAIKLCEKYENIYFSIGVHPYDIDDFDTKPFYEYAKHQKCVAIGECGLDYYRLEANDTTTIQKQKDIFVKQISLAKEFGKPLIVHIRDANIDAKDILIKENAKEVGGVLHCYNANESLLELANYGFYFGIGGVLTFKNAKALPNILPKIPIDKLVIETDAPYLTPHPYRGKRNEPSYTTYIAQEMATILNVNYEEICKISTENAQKLFSLKTFIR